METPLSRRIGLRYPIVCAPMFLLSTADVLVACAEAGILGTMPSLNCRTPEDFRRTLADVRARTDRPFGINIPLKLIDPERLAHDVEACLEFEVPVIITSLGDPTEVTRRAHARGLRVFHDVIGLRHARKAEAAGVDAIIGVAAGAGGHAGTTSPFVLVPYLVENLACPIIAAGCISTGRQLAAALALGAELAYVGTRFIASAEMSASDEYKRACLNGTPEDVVYTDQISGVHGNFLRTTVPDDSGGPVAAKRWKDIWSAGQGVATRGEVLPIAEIVERMVAEYAAVLRGLPLPG